MPKLGIRPHLGLQQLCFDMQHAGPVTKNNYTALLKQKMV